MKIKQFVFNHFGENTYVVIDETTSSCAIIDPGCFRETEKQTLVSFFKSNNLVPDKILFTHCHVDHTFGAHFLLEEYPLIQTYAHQSEQHFIDTAVEQAESFGVTIDQPPAIAHYVYDGQTITIGALEFKVICTPGHSLGCVCYYNKENNILFSGDTLFANSVGRTDLYGSSHLSLMNSIQEKLMVLPENTDVLPGHGPSTTIGEEKNTNPYIQ
mgnify:FL=1